jgi:hypothetical protein
MRLRLVLVVIALLVAGAVVVGCGDDDGGNGGGGGNTAAETTDTGGGRGETTEESGGGSGGGSASNPQIQQAVEACKQQIQAQPNVSDDVKADLEEICEEAASGDEQAVREASKEVCTKLVEENVPEGPAREQALAACDQAGATP